MCHGSTVPPVDLVATVPAGLATVSGGALTRIEVNESYTDRLNRFLQLCERRFTVVSPVGRVLRGWLPEPPI